ncbi:MAG: hypothetical protein Tsb0014_47450 [Pleurocapsa sp.]
MQQFILPSPQTILNLSKKLVAGILLACFSCDAVLANAVIEQAEIYKVRNQVELSRKNKPNWSPAKLGDVIVPQDSVRTGNNSRADILFNEGTLVRTGANTVFLFPPGKRSFELTSGAALIMIRPEQGQSTINTPQAKIVSQGTALFVQHDTENNVSLVGVLTDSTAGLVEVSSADGQVKVKLQAGQFVSIVRGVVGLVEHFVLPMFYETIELSDGLGTGEEEFIAQQSPEVQATIQAVQAEAIAPLKNQIAWLNGFCSLQVESEGISPLLQLLGMGVTGGKVTLELPETDLFVIPFRSIDGITWLSNYCQAQQEKSKLNSPNKSE